MWDADSLKSKKPIPMIPLDLGSRVPRAGALTVLTGGKLLVGRGRDALQPPALVSSGREIWSFVVRELKENVNIALHFGEIERRESDPKKGWPVAVKHSLALLATSAGTAVVTSDPPAEAVAWEP